MRPVYIQAENVASLMPEGGIGTRTVGIELNMTNRQIKRAVVDMLGGFSEGDVYDFFREEFPECFTEEVKA